jgi:hypothetical protein
VEQTGGVADEKVWYSEGFLYGDLTFSSKHCYGYQGADDDVVERKSSNWTSMS